MFSRNAREIFSLPPSKFALSCYAASCAQRWDEFCFSITTILFVPVAAFEDKRKENYEKGQAELERRRKALLEIQKQEREERERLEREEEERKERIR